MHFWNFLVFDSLIPKSLKNENWLRKISQKWPKRSKSKKFKKKPQKHQNYTSFLALWNFSVFGSFLPKNGKNCDFYSHFQQYLEKENEKVKIPPEFEVLTQWVIISMYHRCEICWKTGWVFFFTLGEPLARCAQVWQLRVKLVDVQMIFLLLTYVN